MKIAFSGPANSGKTTLIKEFINKWPNYKTPATSYRDKLKELNLNHSDCTTEETQSVIFNCMNEQLKEFNDEQYIVYDRCPLDCLVYTLQAYDTGGISDDFMEKMVEDVRESLTMLDAIFVLPYNPNYKIENNGVRNTDLNYILKTDSIFKNIMHEYYTNFDEHYFFPKDCPGIIELEDDNKLLQIAGLINNRGDMYDAGEDEKLNQMFGNSLNTAMSTKTKMENLISYQQTLGEDTINKNTLKYDKFNNIKI